MNTGILTFQVGPQAWIYVPVDLTKIRYISLVADWPDSTYSLYINGKPVFARLKKTDDGEDL